MRSGLKKICICMLLRSASFLLAASLVILPLPVSIAQDDALSPESRISNEEFRISLTVASICKHIEQDGNLDDTSDLTHVLARLGEKISKDILVLPHEIFIEIPSEGLAVRYFDPAKAEILTPYQDVASLSTISIGPRLTRQIIKRIKVLPSTTLSHAPGSVSGGLSQLHARSLRTRAGSVNGVSSCVSDFTPAPGQHLTVSLQTTVSKSGQWIGPSDRWPIDAHISAIKESYGTDTAILGYVGNGNAICNKGHIVFLNRELHYSKTEPVQSRVYSMLVAYKSGEFRVLDVKISDSDRIVTVKDGRESDITDMVEWAISGERIVRSGRAVDWREDEAFYGYQDPRHMFWFPYSIFDGRPEEVIKANGRKDVFREILWNDVAKKDSARRGNFIELPLSRFKDFGYEKDYIARELLAAGYNEDEFHFTADDLVIKFRPGLYQHHTIGVTDFGRIKNVAITSTEREKGVTLDELAEVNIANGVTDSIMLDQGGDVFVNEDGKILTGSLDGRKVLISMLFLIDTGSGNDRIIDGARASAPYEDDLSDLSSSSEGLIRLKEMFGSYERIVRNEDEGDIDSEIPYWSYIKDADQWGRGRDTVKSHTMGVLRILHEEGLLDEFADPSDLMITAFFHDFGKVHNDLFELRGREDRQYTEGPAKAGDSLRAFGLTAEESEKYVNYLIWVESIYGSRALGLSERAELADAIHHMKTDDILLMKNLVLADITEHYQRRNPETKPTGINRYRNIMDIDERLKSIAAEKDNDKKIEMINVFLEFLEFEKILTSYGSVKTAAENGALDRLIPEWAEMKDCPQSGPHKFTVGGHILQSIKVAEERGYDLDVRDQIRLNRVLLLHDLGKRPDYRHGQKDRHYEAGAAKSEKILRRLGYSEDEIAKDMWYILYHDMGSGWTPFEDGERNPYLWALNHPSQEDLRMFRAIALADNASKSEGGEHLTEELKSRIDAVMGILSKAVEAKSDDDRLSVVSALRSYIDSLKRAETLKSGTYDSGAFRRNLDRYIDQSLPLLRDLLEEERLPFLLRVPVEAADAVGPEFVETLFSSIQNSPYAYIELFFTSGEGVVGDAVYRKYGIVKKELPASLINRSRTNTVTLLPAFKEDVIDQPVLALRLRGLGADNTVTSPLGLQNDPAGILRSTMLGLQIMELARQAESGSGSMMTDGHIDIDKVQSQILEQVKLTFAQDVLKNVDITPDDIIALATGNINHTISALNKLIKLLPVTPIDAEELRKIYEHARAVITAA